MPFIPNRFNGDTSHWPNGEYRRIFVSEFAERVKSTAGPERAGFKCGLMGLFGDEPLIHREYLLEAARLCHERGCASKVYTNGYIAETIVEKVARTIDVIVVGVKGSASTSAYNAMDADPSIVLRSIKLLWETKREDTRNIAGTQVHNLVGPSLEPSDGETEKFGAWLAKETDPTITTIVIPMYKPQTRFIDPLREQTVLVPSDTVQRAGERMMNTGRILWESGLENVWVQASGTVMLHIPDLRRWGT